MSDDPRPPSEEHDDEQQRRVPITVRDRRLRLDDDEDAGTGAEPSEPTVEDRLAESEQLATDRLDQLMRLKADFENYRKRVIREQTDLAERASLRVVERLLPVIDDIERALEAARSHEGADGIVRGVELVSEHLMEVLRAEGLERVEAEGEPFDPHRHEAVQSQPGDVAEPTVLEVVRPGYVHKDRTIRAALVNVTTPRPDDERTESDEGGG